MWRLQNQEKRERKRKTLKTELLGDEEDLEEVLEEGEAEEVLVLDPSQDFDQEISRERNLNNNNNHENQENQENQENPENHENHKNRDNKAQGPEEPQEVDEEVFVEEEEEAHLLQDPQEFPLRSEPIPPQRPLSL